MKTEEGALPEDSKGRTIQVATNIQMEDDTATPLVSPQTNTGTVTTLVIPANAVALIMLVTGTAVRYGENTTLDGTAGDGYGLIPDGASIALPCANLEALSFNRDPVSGTATLYFHFERQEG